MNADIMKDMVAKRSTCFILKLRKFRYACGLPPLEQSVARLTYLLSQNFDRVYPVRTEMPESLSQFAPGNQHACDIRIT